MIDYSANGIQVLGVSGISRPCLHAIEAILDSAALPTKATVVTLETRHDTGQEEHLFVFWNWCRVPVTIVRNGFSSGYSGEGPRSFSLAICMIRSKGIPIDGFWATEGELWALDRGELNRTLYNKLQLDSAALRWPWPPWVNERHEELLQQERLWTKLGWDRSYGDIDRALLQVRNHDELVWRKLGQALKLTEDCTESEESQPAGVLLRDAWIELAQKLAADLNLDEDGKIGANDAKAMLRRIIRDAAVHAYARDTFDWALKIQHDRDIDPVVVRRCVLATILAMATVLRLAEPSLIPSRTYRKCPRCGSLKVIETTESLPDFDGPPIPYVTAACSQCGWEVSWQP